MNALDAVVQVVEAALVDLAGDFGADAGEGPALVGDDAVVGFADAAGDGLDVQRAVGPHVDDFDVQAFFFERFGGFEGEVHRAAGADDGAVGAFFDDFTLAQGDDEVVVVFRWGPQAAVQVAAEVFVAAGAHAQHAFGFEVEERVGVLDAGLQEALGVAGGGGHGELEARDRGEHAFDRPRVGGAELAAGAVVAAEDDGAAELAAAHVEHLGGVVDDLVGADQAEAPAHELDDGLEAGHGGADAQPGEAGFADGAVDDAAGAELVEHAFGHLVGAVVFRDFFAHEEDVVVFAHLLFHGLAEGFAVLNLAVGSDHGGRSLWGGRLGGRRWSGRGQMYWRSSQKTTMARMGPPMPASPKITAPTTQRVAPSSARRS